jgi:hypothetical protein
LRLVDKSLPFAFQIESARRCRRVFEEEEINRDIVETENREVLMIER